MTYLEYVNLATTFTRKAVKESARKKYWPREEVHFRKTIWKDGKPGKKELIEEKSGLTNKK